MSPILRPWAVPVPAAPTYAGICVILSAASRSDAQSKDEGDSVADTIPEVIAPRSDADYFEVMTRAVFQAGVRWKQIAAQWDAYRDAFSNSIRCGSRLYGELDLERVLATPGILRMPKASARDDRQRACIPRRPTREHGTFANYLRSFDSYAALAKDFKRRFALMGDMNVWYFLFRTGEPVPRFEAVGEDDSRRASANARDGRSRASPRTLARTT